MKRKILTLLVAVIVNAVLVIWAALPYFVTYAEKLYPLPKSLESCACAPQVLQSVLSQAVASGRWQVLGVMDITLYGLVALALVNLSILALVMWKYGH